MIDTALLSAITALVAVAVSPIVSIYIARRQIRASVVSTNRQKWIDQLRDQLAELVTSIKFLNLQRSLHHLSEAEWVERFQRTHFLENKISLLLNPKEPDHVALSKTIRQAVEAMVEKEGSRDSLRVLDHTDSVVQQAQAILKREWERVKSGD